MSVKVAFFRVVHEPRGGDSPYGWGSDAYEVVAGPNNHHVRLFRDKKDADKLCKDMNRDLRRFLWMQDRKRP